MRLGDEANSEPDRGRRAFLRAGLGAAVVAGWVLHDLAVFATTGEPVLAWQLFPLSAAAVLIGALVGLASARLPFVVPTLALACAVLIGFSRVVDVDWTDSQRWFPRAVLLLALGFLVAARRRDRGGIRTALLAGLLGCALVAGYRDELRPVSWVLVAAAAVAAAAVSLRSARWRRAVAFACVVLPAAFVVVAARTGTALRRADLPPAERAGAVQAPNLLLIVLDTVRADRLAPYGHERETTPGLDAFAAEHATRFANFRSTSSWTLPSHASMFTGLLPDEHGATRPRTEHDGETVTLQAWPGQRLRPDVPTLAEVLRGAGFATAAVLANNSFLRNEFGLERGFRHYDDRPSAWLPDYLALVQLAGARPRVGFLPYRDGGTITGLALRWLDSPQRRAPFFLFVNYMDAHAPYIPPPEHEAAFGEPVPRDRRFPEGVLRQTLYDRELRYLDAQVTRLLDGLRERGLFEDTVVLVTSDHGEAFGEHGYWLHGWNLHDEVLRVPLYLKPAGPRRTEVVEEPATGADVFRLALSELGLDPGPARDTGGVIGQLYLTEFLREAWEQKGVDEVDLAQIAWLDGDVKVLVGVDGRVQAYDLAADPDELVPLELSEERIAAARDRAQAWWRDHPPSEAAAIPLDEDELERLRGLGYVGDE